MEDLAAVLGTLAGKGKRLAKPIYLQAIAPRAFHLEVRFDLAVAWLVFLRTQV